MSCIWNTFHQYLLVCGNDRVRVEGMSVSFPLHLCIYQNTSPSFAELIQRMRRAASQQVQCHCIVGFVYAASSADTHHLAESGTRSR